MKVILQHDERDCGAACLAMIAGHYGYSDSIKNFRDLTNTDQDGTSLDEMSHAATSIGLSAEALSGDVSELCQGIKSKEVVLPCIAHVITEDNHTHFVVIADMNAGEICLYDPAKGKAKIDIDAFTEMWTGYILKVVPGENFKKHRNKSHDFLSFFSLLKGQDRRFAVIILISTLISGIGIIGAFVFQVIIDHSSEMVEEIEAEAHGLEHHEHDIEFLTDSETLNNLLGNISNFFGHLTVEGASKIFACLIGLYIFAALIQYIRGRLIIAMSKEIDLGLTLPYFNRIMDLPVSSVLTRRTGEYISRYADASSIRNAISAATITMVIDTMMAAGCALILYFQNVRLFLIAMAIIGLYLAIVLGNAKRIKESNREFMEQNAYIQSYMKESIDGIQAIKSVNASDGFKKKMSFKFSAYLEAAIKRSRIVMGQDVMVTAIETVGIAIILWQGFTLVIQSSMTLGTLITFYALLGYLITPVKNLIELQPIIQSAVVAAERMNDILEMDVETISGKDMNAVEEIKEWSVRSLDFQYGHQDMLLKNVDFSLGKGQKVAIVGVSGSGKTTLAKLFTRFYEPVSGGIYLDDICIDEYSIESLRNAVAYVSSDASLFSGTLFENLTMGNNTYSDEEIKDVCRITQLDELMDELPDGMKFRVSEGGANLSNGQKQRISIARALLRKPKMLILDEATSNIDRGMETRIINAIEEANPEMTILMITHRLSAVRCFDKIVTMMDGKVSGEGTHEELLVNCPEYQMLLGEGKYTP